MTALYVHIPFCETKCPYCDFNSFAIEGLDVDRYLDALAREMDARGVPPDPLTIFIGGGTPTVVSPEQLERYLHDITARVQPDPAREFTVEANPGSLSAEKLAVLAECGVNRISVGAQALFAPHLTALGRVHDVADIEEAVALVRDSGIAGFNLDFIYGVPGMLRSEWIETLERAIEWDPGHLSCYALIYEPGTEFTRRKSRGSLRPIPEEDELFMFRWTERRLRAAGYERYEISNFARPGLACQHNVNYWRNGSYAGFGAGAHSYQERRRSANERRLDRYQTLVHEQGHAVVSSETLPGEAVARETVAFGLRTAAGVDLDELGLRFGLDLAGMLNSPIREMEAARLVVRDPRLRITRRGWLLADAVASAFI
ncbi:MAG: radical SAM family heme chaperone HemW [Planctomycetota bacterium]|jgi:oxygen-independent coproporphyrinogen-3 oxidase